MGDNNILEDKGINELINEKYKFEIPAYQRGYRWESEHVKKLLNDIKNSLILKEYYLQPIIVKNEGNNKYILIDGQQRLTTLYLILKYSSIDDDCYSIEYTNYNKKSKPIEEKIKEFKEKESIEKENLNDYYYEISLMTIKDFSEKYEYLMQDICEFIKNKIIVMWYELNKKDENEIKTFLRVNSGKIKLTQADLLKAKLLKSKENIEITNKIGREWNELEKKLYDDSFWYFISNNVTNDRMTEFLELISSIPRDKIYDNYEERIDKGKKEEEIWKEIKADYELINEWYIDDEIYNYIGFISHNEKLSGFLKDYKNKDSIKNKDDFRSKIKEKIKEIVWGENITFSTIETEIKEKLDYNNDRGRIMKILLLYNVLKTGKLVEKCRFPFEKYYVDKNKKDENKKIEWSLEHIRSQHQDNGISEENYDLYTLYFMQRVYDEKREDDENSQKKYEKCKKIYEILKEYKAQELKNNGELKREIDKEIEIYMDSEFNIHKIGNLALLSKEINSSNQNFLFYKKRENIIGKSADNYIPLCTMNVFLKSFSEYDNKSFLEWEKMDYDKYIEDILNTLKELFMEGEEDGD